jgi:signal transduction histidine kinase
MPPEKGRLLINSHSHPSDDWVVTEVEDNGRGMPPDVLERAFDPFFSQRPAGRGRGLGLSIARRLIELNQGRVRIDSTPGQGTKVTLSLPTAPPNDP